MSSSAINLKGAAGRDVLRNLIANPAFDEWSRGNSFDFSAANDTAKAVNGPDNWVLYYFPDHDGTTTDNMSLEKRPHVIGQTDVEANPSYFTRIKNGKITTGDSGGDVITFSQQIPNVRLLQDKTVTLGFYAKGGTAGMTLAVGFTQVFGISGGPNEFGDGGTASDPVRVTGQQVSLQTDWTKHNLRFNIPSISGKFIGTSGSNYTQLDFYVHAGGTAALSTNRDLPEAIQYDGHTLDIANIQLEEGVDLSPFENIQNSHTFTELVGARVTAIAAGQVTKAAQTLEDALSGTYSDLTSLNANELFFINLNDYSDSHNNILKFGKFFEGPNATNPIFIVAPSVAGSAGNNNDMEDFTVAGFTTDDKRVLGVISGQTMATDGTSNITFNVYAQQLSLGAADVGGGADPDEPGSNDEWNNEPGGDQDADDCEFPNQCF